LSTPEGRNLALVLTRKAEGDAKAMRLLAGNSEIDDESVGFHAQQAIEKWIKAVMASRGLPEERTHDLAGLLDILEAAEIEAPPGADWLDFLTVFAVPLRYEERLDFEALERKSIVALVDQVGEWGRRLIEA
jgi:HEPN domain-containing protein